MGKTRFSQWLLAREQGHKPMSRHVLVPKGGREETRDTAGQQMRGMRSRGTQWRAAEVCAPGGEHPLLLHKDRTIHEEEP